MISALMVLLKIWHFWSLGIFSHKYLAAQCTGEMHQCIKQCKDTVLYYHLHPVYFSNRQ